MTNGVAIDASEPDGRHRNRAGRIALTRARSVWAISTDLADLFLRRICSAWIRRDAKLSCSTFSDGRAIYENHS